MPIIGAHVGTCSNPSCRAEVPLLKQFYLVNKPGKKVYLNPIIDGNKIDFEIETGEYILDGWNNRGNLKCPCCGNTTYVKQIKEQSKSGVLKQRIIAVIEEGENGKNYRLPTKYEIQASKKIPEDIEMFRPTEQMQRNSAGGDTFSWGYSVWGQMFSTRQLLAMQTFVNQLNLLKIQWRNNNFELDEYQKALATYLGILIDRLAIINTTFGVYHTGRETIERPMGRQAIPMVFDYPESNPFCSSSGSAMNQIEWLTRYINDENNIYPVICNHTSSGEKNQFDKKYLNAVITDPPYYDAIAYADISDFFYVWLKRTLGDVFPFNFATPQTQKQKNVRL